MICTLSFANWRFLGLKVFDVVFWPRTVNILLYFWGKDKHQFPTVSNCLWRKRFFLSFLFTGTSREHSRNKTTSCFVIKAIEHCQPRGRIFEPQGIYLSPFYISHILYKICIRLVPKYFSFLCQLQVFHRTPAKVVC